MAEFELFQSLIPALSWKGAADRVEQLRMVKDAGELDLICEAIGMAERAFVVFRNLLRPEDTEKDLCDAMEGYIRRVGGQESSFRPIVAVAERAALPHAPPTSRAVNSGGLLLVDWGVNGGLYKSDLTRVLDTRTKSTFAANKGDATKLEEVYAVVLQCPAGGHPRRCGPAFSARRWMRRRAGSLPTPAMATISATAWDTASACRFTKGRRFGRNLDDGVAARHDLHDRAGHLPAGAGAACGMEDDVLVTADGCEVLSHLTRDLADMRAFA